LIENEVMTPNGYTPLSVMLTDACVSTILAPVTMVFSPSIRKGVVIEENILKIPKVEDNIRASPPPPSPPPPPP
jgi:hypothetical protein